MFLPTPVYETLPALYITGGVAAASTIDSSIAMFSGTVLGLAGILIFSLRHKYRLKKSMRRQ